MLLPLALFPGRDQELQHQDQPAASPSRGAARRPPWHRQTHAAARSTGEAAPVRAPPLPRHPTPSRAMLRAALPGCLGS